MTQRGRMKEILFGTPARRDLWWIALSCLLVFFLAGELELFEEIHNFTRDQEDWNIDEIFTVLMFLPFAFIFFILRRHRELQLELEMRKLAERTALHLAHFDPLTGVLNRSLLKDRLAQAIARTTRNRSKLAVLFIDLDGFKQVNDNFGHTAGDELLCEVARRIQKQIREQDSLVRMGGDEFVVMFDEVEVVDQISQVAQRLIAEIRMPWRVSGVELSLSASIGISVFSGLESVDGEHLVWQADQAMYQAKSEGKNQYVFFADLPAVGREPPQSGILPASQRATC